MIEAVCRLTATNGTSGCSLKLSQVINWIGDCLKATNAAGMGSDTYLCSLETIVKPAPSDGTTSRVVDCYN